MKIIGVTSRVMLAGICAALICPGSGFAADFWLKDPDTGCEIWSDEAPTETEVVSWTGACLGGKAVGEGTGS